MQILNKVRVCAKLTLFGEWAVLEGAPGIAVPLNVYLDCTLQKASFEKHGILLQTKNDQFLMKDTHHVDRGFFKLASSSIHELCKNSPQSKNKWMDSLIEFHREWRLEEGLGSSSAVFLALTLIQEEFLNSRLSKQALFEKYLPLYRHLMGGRASGLDLATQIMGQAVILESQQIESINLSRPNQLWVIHTGQKVSTQDEVRSRRIIPSSLRKIEKSTLSFIKNRNWADAIEEHFEAQMEMKIVPEDILESKKRWSQLQLIKTLKCVGAGGGDALLCLVEEGMEDILLREIKALSWWKSNYDWCASPARLEQKNPELLLS